MDLVSERRQAFLACAKAAQRGARPAELAALDAYYEHMVRLCLAAPVVTP